MLRRTSTTRLLAIIAPALVVLCGGTAIAVAAIGGSGATPPRQATRPGRARRAGGSARPGRHRADLLHEPPRRHGQPPAGLTPLLSGASGRLWATADGRIRLELQSDRGDAQITSDGKTVTILDGSSNQAYRITLPHRDTAKHDAKGTPSVADIQRMLGEVAASADVGSAVPSNVAGRPAYTVRISPKHDGGLTNAAELAWDAATGTPLRAAVYAWATPSRFSSSRRRTSPSAPSRPPTSRRRSRPGRRSVRSISAVTARVSSGPEVTGAGAVSKAISFRARRAGHARRSAAPCRPPRRLRWQQGRRRHLRQGAGRHRGPRAAVDDRRGEQHPPPAEGVHQRRDGQELATALGTVVRFERGGVTYTSRLRPACRGRGGGTWALT